MRREIDNVYKRKKYKEEQYGDKKSRTDDYTGKRVFRGNTSDAKHKHSSDKISDTDHITPLDVVERRYKGLSKEQQAELANNSVHNYATTNSKLNRSKGKLENHEYLMRQFMSGNPENLETSTRMIAKEINSRTVMRAEAMPMYIENYTNETRSFFSSEQIRVLNEAGWDEAMSSVAFATSLSVTRNVISVYKGEEEIDEAVKDILIDTSSAAILGYVTGVTMEKLAVSKSDASLLVNGTIQISKEIISYVNSNIDEEELIEHITEDIAYLVAAQIGKCIGEVLIPIPLVGSYVGEMITTAICAETISTIKFSKEFEKKNSKMISLYKNAEQQIRESQARLEDIIQKENNELLKSIEIGFEDILEGIRNNSMEQIDKGLLIIGEKFGLSEKDLSKDLVTKDNLFTNVDDVLVIE